MLCVGTPAWTLRIQSPTAQSNVPTQSVGTREATWREHHLLRNLAESRCQTRCSRLTSFGSNVRRL
jgi:hypothetical protein